MAYTINKFNGEPLVTLQDASVDTSTSLQLVGRSYVGYGELQNENFLHLMENFANDAPPARPLEGQTWFDTENNLLNVYDGEKWGLIGSAVVAETAPESASNGAFWFKSTNKTLHVWNGENWIFIGPETADGFGITRSRSTTLLDSDGNLNPVILLTINDTVIGIVSSRAFTIAPTSTRIPGFNNIVAGITVSDLTKFKGNLEGIADQATRLQTTRTINGVGFNGTSNITIKSSTIGKILPGNNIIGVPFDGSIDTTWNIDGTSANVIGKIVVRNSEGGFAAGTITADLVGNVLATQGTSKFDIIEANKFVGATLTGNANTATRLRDRRQINGVDFDGTENITVPASASTLTGDFINSNVLSSNLERVGVLKNLKVLDEGVAVGVTGQLKLSIQTGIPTISSSSSVDFIVENDGPNVSFVTSTRSLNLGGPNEPAIVSNNQTNLGIPSRKFNKVYANSFEGNAITSTLSTTAENLKGGAVGSIPYQTAQNTTGMLPIGAPGQVLSAAANNQLIWRDEALEDLTPGQYILGGVYNTQAPIIWNVDATTTNTASKIVARDSNGDIFASTFRGAFEGTSTTQPSGDDSNKLATTAFVKNVISALPTQPLWAGTSTFANVVATYSSFPIGTKVAYWEERVYFRPANSNGGSVQINDRYRRVIRKNSASSWGDVGG